MSVQHLMIHRLVLYRHGMQRVCQTALPAMLGGAMACAVRLRLQRFQPLVCACCARWPDTDGARSHGTVFSLRGFPSRPGLWTFRPAFESAEQHRCPESMPVRGRDPIALHYPFWHHLPFSLHTHTCVSAGKRAGGGESKPARCLNPLKAAG